MSKYFNEIKKGLEEIIIKKHGMSVKELKAKQAKKIIQARKKTNLSQKDFSEKFDIPLSSLQKWEQGQRTPTGAAQTLLHIIAKNPKFALEALRK